MLISFISPVPGGRHFPLPPKEQKNQKAYCHAYLTHNAQGFAVGPGINAGAPAEQEQSGKQHNEDEDNYPFHYSGDPLLKLEKNRDICFFVWAQVEEGNKMTKFMLSLYR